MKFEIAIRLMAAMIGPAIYIYFMGWRAFLLFVAIDVALAMGIVAAGTVCLSWFWLIERFKTN